MHRRGFYFDVGGVIIPDRFGEDARGVFVHFAHRHPSLNAERAYGSYCNLQPGLDLGTVSLEELCEAIGLKPSVFKEEWLAIHKLDDNVLRNIKQLVAYGHPVGLATNFCRRLLDRLLDTSPVLKRLRVCCSADIGVQKPDTAFFQHAATLIDASEIIFVDDRAKNVEAARRFGWIAIQAEVGWLPLFARKYVHEKASRLDDPSC